MTDLHAVLLDTAAALRKAAEGMEALLKAQGDEPEPRLTPKEVAAHLKVSVDTVEAQIKTGALRAIKVSSGKKNLYRVRPADLAAFEAKRSRA